MILVDSSVWIDYFRGDNTWQTDLLDDLLPRHAIAIGDLILAEVLCGFRDNADFLAARKLLLSLPVLQLGGVETAVLAAENYRKLRARGVTISKTIDMIIATRCIVDKLTLLHDDRDFEPFAEFLKLRVLRRPS